MFSINKLLLLAGNYAQNYDSLSRKEREPPPHLLASHARFLEFHASYHQSKRSSLLISSHGHLMGLGGEAAETPTPINSSTAIRSATYGMGICHR